MCTIELNKTLMLHCRFVENNHPKRFPFKNKMYIEKITTRHSGKIERGSQI